MAEGTGTVTTRRLRTGRAPILSSPVAVTRDNVAELIDRALAVHSTNAADANYLHRYFLGEQPVLRRLKKVRPDINNAIVENRAYQICKDRTDSLAGEPITYSAHNASKDGGESVSASVQLLNDACVAADKHACDLELVQWMNEVGVGYRLVMPAPTIAEDPSRPFVVASLDPRSTFVVRSNSVFREPLWACTYVTDPETHEVTYTAYAPDRVFVVSHGVVLSEGHNPLGAVPIVEYQANPERMGVFEAVISLFDAINEVESNRVDGVAQFVQALMVLKNVDLGDTASEARETFKELVELGAIQITSTSELPADVEMLTAQLDQEQTQTLVDSFYKTALSICGMPFNVGGSASTSDTGAAVTMRDGWSNAENRCKETETLFKRSERDFLRIALPIVRAATDVWLEPSDVEVKFTRRNYEAIQSKTQVLTTLLGSGKVAPRLAFQYCGMFSDPEDAYDQSMAYVDEQESKAREALQATPGGDAGGDSEDPGDGDEGGVSARGMGTRTPSTSVAQEGEGQ
ncbi:phage portal protein [Olsenella phocaeensis]|uniref:phage portal protein n=1 Tax=Olsenella phocaeensis TaxID=1852385 RepID=UPI000930B6D7|nr:phage portal protein [Olsenella phocaeensis]